MTAVSSLLDISGTAGKLRTIPLDFRPVRLGQLFSAVEPAGTGYRTDRPTAGGGGLSYAFCCSERRNESSERKAAGVRLYRGAARGPGKDDVTTTTGNLGRRVATGAGRVVVRFIVLRHGAECAAGHPRRRGRCLNLIGLPFARLRHLSAAPGAAARN